MGILSCTDHDDIVVSYIQHYTARGGNCPLCQTLTRVTELEFEVKGLESQVRILEDDVAELQSDVDAAEAAAEASAAEESV